MGNIFDYTFGYLVFFYSAALVVSYFIMAILAFTSHMGFRNLRYDPVFRNNVRKSPYTPGVSIVAGAYNEEAVVVECVESFLRQDYPKFEVIIVNDGSTDKTLEKMIEHFELIEVPYSYIERIHTRPYKRLFRSSNPKYHNLTIVDKENGGTKADAINAGLNVVQYAYFVNTDVDCILSRDAIMQCIRPVLHDSSVIAVSGSMALNNGCKIAHGDITHRAVGKSYAPLFQSLEYLRSFLLAKTAWSHINAMPNVSGGYGLFSTTVAINAGGYNPASFAEDMDMLIRMIGYMCDLKRPYRVVQIPNTCCWTQGPPNLKILHRQRVRWERGLIQTFVNYSGMILNHNYKRLGMITLPYILIFEFLAPVIEAVGMVCTLWWGITGKINWVNASLMFAAIVVFNYLMATIVYFYDFWVGSTYGNKKQYLWLLIAAIFEPILYHPLIVIFSIKGYFNYLTSKRSEWGKMVRKKYTSGDEGNDVEESAAGGNNKNTQHNGEEVSVATEVATVAQI